MPSQERERRVLAIAPRHAQPPGFPGTPVQWRALCDLYPAAETPEVILAVLEYCSVRKLDVFRRPCHIIPMWNSKLRAKVQVILQGITELEITAARTELWAGMDEPIWGPDETRKFKGSFEDERGETREQEIELTFPIYCMVPIWRLVKGERQRFVEPVYWIEAYGRAGFRSELPNARWSQAPHQMLHKCAKAAVLRAAFPEEIGEYAAEEMDGHEADTGGITLDGMADYGTGDGSPPARERTPLARPQELRAPVLADLEEKDQGRWLITLQALLNAATTDEEIEAIQNHHSVQHARANAPPLLRQMIDETIRKARKRISPIGVS